MVSLLLVKGANVKAKDRKERTPLHLAAYMGMMSACIVLYSTTYMLYHGLYHNAYMHTVFM